MKRDLKKVKRIDVEHTYRSILSISLMHKIPLKRIVSKNLPIISEIRNQVIEEREMLKLKMLVLDDNGEFAMKEGYVPSEKDHSIPMDQLVYEEGWDVESAKQALQSFDESEVDLDLFQEDIRSSVVLSGDFGYKTISVDDLLYDPNNDLNSKQIVMLKNLMLFDSTFENL